MVLCPPPNEIRFRDIFFMLYITDVCNSAEGTHSEIGLSFRGEEQLAFSYCCSSGISVAARFVTGFLLNPLFHSVTNNDSNVSMLSFMSLSRLPLPP